MKRWIKLAVRLYPKAWRARYGAEFDALLDQSSGGWKDFADVTRGAIAMNLTLRKTPLMFALLGLATGLAFWAWKPAEYDAAVSIPFDGALHERTVKALNRQTLSAIIQRNRLYQSQRARHPMEEVVEEMRSQIRIRRSADSTARLDFHYGDRASAQRVAAELALALGVAEARPEVIEMKSSPWIPIALGMTGGIFAAFLLVPEARRALAWGLLCSLLIYAASWTLPDRYRSTAIVRSDLPGAEGATHVERRGPFLLVANDHSDPAMAQRGLEAILRRHAAGEIVDPPSYPQSPISPNRTVLAGGGMAAGVLLRIWRRRTP